MFFFLNLNCIDFNKFKTAFQENYLLYLTGDIILLGIFHVALSGFCLRWHKMFNKGVYNIEQRKLIRKPPKWKMISEKENVPLFCYQKERQLNGN